ncbi:hypothetical protein OS493_010322 [Desmophyllum pertusum]|uniref:Uncharacterized protein n=1 Tax=Desmophyllum pertusum TaxID=174260 RepID=A0A9X0A3F4_9CNID|nr:hypothetical protein OS493_010322 [Desmophyllum pertusum]
MSKRYDFAMQRHGQGQGKGQRGKKQRKNKMPIKGLDFQTVSLFKDPKESDYEASWRKDLFSPEDKEEEKAEPPVIEEDIPIPYMQWELVNRILIKSAKNSPLLNDYESLYDDNDQQGYAAMQEHLSGQMAMESMLTDYKSLCREREDSLDVDEEEVLDELENLSRKEQSVDMEGAQIAIQDTFQNVRNTTDRLKMMNKKMFDLSKQGEATEELESEKRQLERELHMYKKMAVQQRKDIFSRRSSVRRDETQQWKLVAGEMVDILKMVRHEGNVDKESLEKELNRIIMTLNTQTEYIDNLKRDLSKQEKNVKNLEKDKTRLNNDKLLVEDQLQTKQIELKQCKQYLRKVLTEKKDLGDKIKIDGAEIDLAEGTDEIKLVSGVSEDMTATDILQAQVRDARKVVFKFEEENRELQRKLASLPGAKELPAAETSAELEPSSSVVVEHNVEHVTKECTKCPSYKAQLANCSEEIKKKEADIERLKDEMNKLRSQLRTSKKDTVYVKSELALAEAEVKEEILRSDGDSAIEVSVEKAATAPQTSSEHDTESGEEEIKVKPKKASKLAVPAKKQKQKPVKSPKRRKKVSKAKQQGKEIEQEEEEEEEEVFEEEDKNETKALKAPKQKQKKGFGFKPRDLVLGECREEKAPYVTVREAKMVTLADKTTQTSHYDRKATEGITQRHSVVRQPQHRRRSLAEAIMAGVAPNLLEQETHSAMMFIKDEADRLCDEISGFVEYGFDIVQQGAKTTRLLTETHLGEKAVEMLESSDPGSISIDRAKAVKALMSSDHRRQSIVASKKRRPSIHLERRGTIRRDSKLPVSHTPTEGMFGRKREDSISTDADGAHPELDKTSAVLTEQKEDALAGIEGRNEQTSDSVTGQRDTAVTTEQGPPAARVNTLFPDQQTLDNAQAQPKGGGDSSSKVLQQEKGDDNRSSKKIAGWGGW